MKHIQFAEASSKFGLVGSNTEGSDLNKTIHKRKEAGICVPQTDIDQSYYVFQTGKQGEERLNILNKIYNEASQSFIKKIGLRSGMQVLELGCGTGEMSIWLAKNTLPDGKVIAVDISQEQINIARELALKEGVTNIEFHVSSAYEIASLDLEGKLDMVFSRFVLIHLTNHEAILRSLKNLLKCNSGILIIQDGIASLSLSYPESELDKEIREFAFKASAYYGKDYDFGKKLLELYNEIKLNPLDYELHIPLLKTEEERSLVWRGLIESKDRLIQDGLLDAETANRMLAYETNRSKNLNLLISAGASIIIAGKKQAD